MKKIYLSLLFIIAASMNAMAITSGSNASPMGSANLGSAPTVGGSSPNASTYSTGSSTTGGRATDDASTIGVANGAQIGNGYSPDGVSPGVGGGTPNTGSRSFQGDGSVVSSSVSSSVNPAASPNSGYSVSDVSSDTDSAQ